MAVDIDIAHLGSYLSFPEPSLSAALSEPTAELVASLLRSVASKAREHEQVQAAQSKLEVELENAVRGAELKTRTLKASVDKGVLQITELREKLSAAESAKSNLDSELQNLRTSTSTSDSEVSKLTSRIASLESSNRDTVSLLEAKSTAYSEISNDLVTKQQKINDLRGEISQLEQVAQNANSATVAAKLREQNLQQEVEVLRRNNDWLDSELKTKSSEFSKFRKEKNARLAELQRENEDGAATIDSLQRSDKSLRSRVEELSQKADAFLVQMRELREEADRKEESLSAELDTTKRLEKLMEESVKTTKQRQQDLAEQLDRAKDAAAEEIGRLSAEVETEHQDRVAAERRIAELEAQLEEVRSEGENPSQRRYPGGGRSGASTPGPDVTPSKMKSISTPGKFGGINFTQMVGDYHTARADLEAERKRNAQLSATVDEMIRDIEARQPEILEMQADHSRMEEDLVEMSNYADSMSKERDEARKATKKVERELSGHQREGWILRQQLRDLSSQIKVLLMELNASSQGWEPFTAEQRVQLEKLAREGFQDDLAQEVTDTSRFISQHLTTFRSTSELVEQNTKLLRVAREVGETMEGEEAQAERSQAAQNLRELEELRQKYESSRDEISSLVTQSQSYIKERDMFRRMLSQRGQLPANNDANSIYGGSVDAHSPATPLPADKIRSLDHSPNAKDMEDYRKLLKEMQSHFDTYRQEAAADRTAMKDQLETASRKNLELRNQISKKAGEITLALERYEMLQGNFNMMKSENLELQKRVQASSERTAKQEIRAQQVVEDLIEVKGLSESMRNENANLKAEKEFWKAVETRLMHDNESLLTDRDRLNTLNTSLQTMLNEREHVEVDSRRRLQNQVESLENETQTLKRRLGEEQEEHKRATMRRDYDNTQYQSRIDTLTTSLSSTREELVATQTTRDHLQGRVDELSIKLRSAEEKLNVLQSKPAHASDAQGPEITNGTVDEEQSLKLKIAELRKDSELVQSELTSTRQQVEQYKAISQASEDELRSFNESHEQYRQEMDSAIAAKDSRIKELEQSIVTLHEELAARDAELNDVRTQISQHDAKTNEQKHTFDTEIARLKDACERAEAAAQYHQEDLKTQADIAQQAQQNYESELLKHAEAAKTVQKIRADHNNLKIELAEITTDAEAARSKLKQNEESWTEAKQRYESELSELRSRRNDTDAQNNLLHQQLDSVHRQISDLQKAHKPDGSPGDTVGAATLQADSENQQELVRYLRREKEIVDVQYDLATQETRRLRQQLEQTQNLLEETRQKLGQHRRAEEHNERNVLNHKKLLGTIEELNLNRESNSTLRMEKTQLQTSLNEKVVQVGELQNQITPLQAKITELEGQRETLDQELRLAQEARTRFEQRYLDILNRSNSIDPAEFERLTQNVTELEFERDKLLASEASLQTQVDEIPNQIKQSLDEANKDFLATRQKIVDQSKNRDRTQVAKLKEKDAALQEASQAKVTLEVQVKEMEASLERAKKEHQEAVDQIRSNAQAAQQAPSAAVGQQSEGNKGSSAPDSDVEKYASEAASLRERLSAAEERAASAGTKVQEYEAQMKTLRSELDQANAQLAELRSAADSAPPQTTLQSNDEALSAPEIEALRQELAEARQEADGQRAAVLTRESAAQVESSAGSPSIEDQIKSQVDEIRVELTKRHDDRVRQLEETYKTRTQKMQTQLSKRLGDGKADISRELEAGHSDAMVKLREEHTHEINQLNERHAREVAELRNIANKSSGMSTDPVDNASTATQTGDIHDQLTDVEVRKLLQTNEEARRRVANSMANREAMIRDEQQKVLSQKLAEAEAKAKQAQEQAVNMEGKRHSVKLNMAENRARSANAKIEAVKQAATDTPEKPVSEVWAVAQNAKPAPATPAGGLQQSSHAPTAASSAQPGVTATTTESPIIGQVASDQSSKPSNASALASAPAPGDAGQQPTTQGANSRPNVTKGIGASTHAPSPSNKSAAAGPTSSGATAEIKAEDQQKPPVQQSTNPEPAAGPTGPRSQGQSNIPGPGGRSGIPQPGGGRGTAIPQPGQTRGGANAGRGRGRGGSSGAGRGAAPAISTATTQGAESSGQSSNSPKTMSATAKQFVPRKRDAAGAGLEGSVHANDNKRAKPGGG